MLRGPDHMAMRRGRRGVLVDIKVLLLPESAAILHDAGSATYSGAGLAGHHPILLQAPEARPSRAANPRGRERIDAIATTAHTVCIHHECACHFPF